ncbi:hypothetical protein [Clostridium sp. CH2]|uniref:hypothetical protein n=1 Tax=Clostridium sp. CH2 TaxID=2949990 RepID=UPI00207A3E46|nr:hypothetical protein [Clostridium sp. CH2]
MEHTEYNTKNIFSGNIMPVVTNSIKLAAAQVANELSVVYYDSTKKEYFTVESESQKADANKAYGLSALNVASSESAIEIPVYLTGEFNKNSIVVPNGKDLEELTIELRSKGIFLK